MSIKKTPLDKGQYSRLLNVIDEDKIVEEPLEIYFVEVENTPLTKVEIKFADHEEHIYLTREDYDLVKNGIKLEREEY